MDAMGKPTWMYLWRTLFRKGGWALGRVLGVAFLGLIQAFDYRTYIKSQATLDLAAPRRWRSISRTFGTDAITWTASLPFAVAKGYRIQNTAL